MASADPDSRPAVVPPVPFNEDHVVLRDGRLLGFAEFGDPTGRPVLWFHGTPGARKQLPPETPDEAERRRLRVIVVERPGTGFSTPHLYDRIGDFSSDVVQLADQLGLTRFGVAGLSGGGPFVLAVAHDLPDRVVAAAVLGGIGPTAGPEKAPGYTRLLAPFSPLLHALKAPLAEVLNGVVGRLPLRTIASPAFDLYGLVAPPPDRPLLRRAEFKAMFIQDMVDALDSGMRAPIYDLYLFSKYWGFRLRDIRVPVRFWHGDADVIVPVSHGRHQADLVPGSRLVTVPDGGHFSGFETVPVVLDVFEEVWPVVGLSGARHAGSNADLGRS